MKSRDMSSSETQSEPYQRRVLLVDATRPIVPHPPPRLSRMNRLPFVLTWKGGSIMQEAVCRRFSKLQVVDRAQAVLRARQAGLG